jgi:hypothetical protein
VCWSLEEFCSLLSNKMLWLAMLQDPWRSGFLRATSINPDLYWHMVTAHFVQVDSSLDTDTFVYSCHWGSLWVEVSTLAYGANFFSWPERSLVAYCSRIIRTKLLLRNCRCPQKIYLYGYRRAHRHAAFSAWFICRGCGEVTWNAAVNLLRTSWVSVISWNFNISNSFTSVGLSL